MPRVTDSKFEYGNSWHFFDWFYRQWRARMVDDQTNPTTQDDPNAILGGAVAEKEKKNEKAEPSPDDTQEVPPQSEK